MTSRHVFEISGLGTAPFQYLPSPKADVIRELGHVFWCEHCGTMLKNRHYILSSDGKVSIVGIDCLNKTGDAGLISAEKAARQQAKEAARQASEKERAISRKAAFTAHYGMTPEEVEQANDSAIDNLENSVRDALEGSSHTYNALIKAGGFGQAMIDEINSIRPLSPNMIKRIAEITAKHASGGRKNSNAYKEAYPQAEQEIRDIAQQIQDASTKITELRHDMMYKWRQLP